MFAFTYFLQEDRRRKALEEDRLRKAEEDRRRKSLDTNKLKPVKTRPSLGFLGGFDYFLGLPTLEELAQKQRDIETLRIMRPIRQKFDWVCVFRLSLLLFGL